MPRPEHSSFSLSKRSHKHLPYFGGYLHLPRIFSAWFLDGLDQNWALLPTNHPGFQNLGFDFSRFFSEATKSHLLKHDWIEKFIRFSFCLKLVEPDGHRGYMEPVAPHHTWSSVPSYCGINTLFLDLSFLSKQGFLFPVYFLSSLWAGPGRYLWFRFTSSNQHPVCSTFQTGCSCYTSLGQCGIVSCPHWYNDLLTSSSPFTSSQKGLLKE